MSGRTCGSETRDLEIENLRLALGSHLFCESPASAGVCGAHRCLRHPRGPLHVGCVVVAGTIKAKGRNDIHHSVFVGSKDKEKDIRVIRMGCPTGVSRMHTGMPEW